jgi:cation diffusion facilitator CzcD-associated flavoprotein CzcO
LETNVDASIMEFSQEPIPIERSAISIARHGTDTPFRPWQTIQQYVQGLVDRKGYQDLVSYNTTVELVSKVNGEWEVVLRKSGGESDYWWKEYFDAVVVANGHYSVPYIPEIKGLDEFERRRPGSVIHTKAYRGRDAYRGKVSRTEFWVVEIFADSWNVACCRYWSFCVGRQKHHMAIERS